MTEEKKETGKTPAKKTAKTKTGVAKSAAHKKSVANKATALKNIAPPDPMVQAAKAKARRRRRATRLALRFLFFVVLPTIGAAIYYTLIATPLYVSTSTFTVQTAGSKPSFNVAALLAGVDGSGSARDSLTVQEYINSRDMLHYLNDHVGFSKHYKSKNADWITRLEKDATFEQEFKYYKDMVIVSYDTASGIITLNVRAFTPTQAQKVAQAIVSQSEKMVNEMSSRIRNDQILFATEAVINAENRLRNAQKAVLDLQQEEAEFNPNRTAGVAMSVQGKLEEEIIKTQTELSQLLTVMSNEAPKVIAVRQKLTALKRQLKKEIQKIIGTGEDGLGSSMAKFETAMMEKGFAEKEYQSAMASLELAKIEAARQTRYLATIASPSLADEPTYPKSFISIITFFLMTLGVMGILSLIIASVKEHARI